MRKTRVLPFEFEVLKRLKAMEQNWAQTKILVAFSGGRDSVVLVNVLKSIQPRLGFKLSIAHVHHGKNSDKKIQAYRDNAVKFANTFGKKNEVESFVLRNSGTELKSEAEFRKVREVFLKKCASQNECSLIAFAHHADDLLETRLIRLIRGTGAQGLKSMAFAQGEKLRPLLPFTSQQIQNYADSQKLKWLNDPTNSQDLYFRNWIRNKWLPQLEKKRKGSSRVMARSLELISESLEHSEKLKPGLEVIRRREFAELSVVEKRGVIARMVLDQGGRDFSLRQIDEILKRLSISRSANRRKMSFEVGGMEWRVNAEQIEAIRL